MRTPFATLALAVLLTGCGPKAGSAPDVLASGQSIAVAGALHAVDEPPAAVVPERLADALLERLHERQLQATLLSDLPADFAASTITSARLQLADEASDADLLLLIEARPIFDSQLAGRFRWAVEVDFTLAQQGRLDAAETFRWDIPVFLLYYHQQEAEALAEATPMIERKMRKALDEFLRGMGGEAAPAPAPPPDDGASQPPGAITPF